MMWKCVNLARIQTYSTSLCDTDKNGDARLCEAMASVIRRGGDAESRSAHAYALCDGLVCHPRRTLDATPRPIISAKPNRKP